MTNYVLGRPGRADEGLVRDRFPDAQGALSDLIAGEFQRAMNRLHSGRLSPSDRNQDRSAKERT